jgi:hypothetical protein
MTFLKPPAIVGQSRSFMGNIQMYYTFYIRPFSLVHNFWRWVYGVTNVHERSITWTVALVLHRRSGFAPRGKISPLNLTKIFPCKKLLL